MGHQRKKVDSNTSAKAVKGVVCVAIDKGTFSINSADDAVYSNGEVVISGGTFSISSGDDGINGAGGKDGSGAPGWPGGIPSLGNYYLYINGGYIVVNALGDGLDVNGSIEMKGGTVIIHGPTSNMNSIVDYDAGFKMTDGFIVAAGSSGMAQSPSINSTQYSLLMNFRSVIAARTLFHIQNSSNTDILTFMPLRSYQSVMFCSSALTKGSSYDVYLGGSSTGTVADGLYEGGTYSGGTISATFTISDIVTTIKK